jgi:HTH-type transcriptional regulator, competence development regulator
MKSLGGTLKESRELIPMTLRQVEEATGISNAYLSQLENDKIKKPSASVLYKLSSIYKMELNSLLRAAGIIQKSTDNLTIDLPSTEWEKRISFYTEELSEEQKGKVLEYIKFIKSSK